MTETPPTLAAVRNIGVVAHVDAGKTTVTERILYYSGRTRQLGSVDDGTTVTDWMDQERERGITIVSAAISADWRDHRINLIDTPGHIDFTAEVQRALRVLDGCVVVFDAVQGVEPQSETVWRQADRYGVPRLCFINKMDRIGADFDHAVSSIRKLLGAEPACVQIPLGTESRFTGVIDLLSMQCIQWSDPSGSTLTFDAIPSPLQKIANDARARLVEQICETDDVLLSLYLEEQMPGVEQLRAALRQATLENRLFPVFCGAALRNIGIQPLLDGIVDYLPSPLDVGDVSGTHPKTGAQISRPAADDAPLAALVFKLANDPYMGHLAYVRVYSGKLNQGQPLHDANTGRKQRANRLVRMYANDRENLDAIHAGDIAAVLGLHEVRTGDTLCAADHPILLETISFPEPVIRATIEPRVTADHDALHEALQRLADEDPTIRLGVDDNSGLTLVSGMGELHLEVLLERLRREFGVAVRMGLPQVTYKETITQPVLAVEGHFEHPGGAGHGQFGHVVLDLEPAPTATGIAFENHAHRRQVPSEFVQAVQEGILSAAQGGVLGGYPVTDVHVRLQGGSSHATDSTELGYRNAAAAAFRDGLRRGRPTLMEPVVTFEVLTPSPFTGTVLGQLTGRRASIGGVEARPGATERIVGTVPLSEMFGYVTELRSATQGRGAFTMEFDHFEPLDPARARSILGLSK